MTKSGLESELVRELAHLLTETGLTEIEYATDRVRIRVVGQSLATAVTVPQVVEQAPPPREAAAPVVVEDPANHPGAVTSPMVGVAYMAPEPGAAPFVRVGDQVAEGQTLLLIEAMKTFNPIPAPRSGQVARVLVADSAPVEYGEPLLIIE